MKKTNILWSIVVIFAIILAFSPITILFLLSLNDSPALPLKNFPTTKWYEALFQFPGAMESIVNSLMVAGVTTLVAVVLGICGGYALVRTRFVGKSFFTGLLLMPMVVPYIIMGISLLSFLLRLGMEPSLITIIIGHILLAIPYATLVLTSRFIGFNISLEEAAMDLGADRLTTFRKITLPLIMPGIITAAILSFIISWEDVAMAVLLAGSQQTAPVFMFSLVTKLPKFVPILTAMSTIMFAFAIVLAILMRKAERFSIS
ncbi:MAG: hypothetical protein APZ16_00145 [Candidatus Hadarchaeum yellowstonense]|uniref:ABC transmembrane type-1 domain-containing protein n=1 Tax=Hadarchaeum yellowstonense TaxID=1776334 RepID=A0A147JXI1_HADYE|nr:MAG: hypothetical protein APZ16_00145 [Candidatus Hadarchaeum yellowstonense]